LVVRLVSKLKNIFGKKVKFADIFTKPTISSLIEYYDSQSKEDSSSLIIALNIEGHLPPIFCAPPAGGGVGSYNELAKCLGKEQPLYAFQCPGLDGYSEPIASLEELASLFIDEMQQIDELGPYRLGGYSFGGKVAFEMALQLSEKGFEVDQLLMFDAQPTSIINWNLETHFLELLKSLVQIINGNFDSNIQLEQSDLKEKSQKERIYILKQAIQKSDLDNEVKNQIDSYLDVFIINTTYNYVPRKSKLNSEIILFKAEQNKSSNLDYNQDYYAYDYGWRRYTNFEVKIIEINDSHENILMQQNLEIIKSHINELIKQ